MRHDELEDMPMLERPSYDAPRVEAVGLALKEMSADLVVALVCLPFVGVY